MICLQPRFVLIRMENETNRRRTYIYVFIVKLVYHFYVLVNHGFMLILVCDKNEKPLFIDHKIGVV